MTETCGLQGLKYLFSGSLQKFANPSYILYCVMMSLFYKWEARPKKLK